MTTNLEVFDDDGSFDEYSAEPKPWEVERPVDRIEVEAEPKRKTLPIDMSSKLQLGLIAAGVTAAMLTVAWVLGFFDVKAQTTYTPEEQSRMDHLEEENKRLREEKDVDQSAMGDKTLAANIADFQGQHKTPAKTIYGNVKLPNKPKPATPPPVPRPRPVRPQNTVRVPQRRNYARHTPPRTTPRLAARPSRPVVQKPSGPSLNECVGYLDSNVNVPGCSKYKLSKKPVAPITNTPPSPQPRQVLPKPTAKPVKLAYAPKPAAPKKSSYEVNYLAGEMQTHEQFIEEFYGSGTTSSPTASQPIEAKVIDKVEWLGDQDAQQLIIPLKITKGTRKGQTAEAKIISMNGTQFVAHVTSLNGSPVQPGTMELRNKGTKYLMAKVKTQGGSSFGDRVLGTALAIGGEAVSDQVGNFRGGNHINRLLPRQQRSQRGGQYFEFKGNVQIVSVSP